MKNAKDVSLYIHIPFCVRKCHYCDFLSAPADDKTMENYIQALLLEIRAYRQTPLSKRTIKSIFIGGGTPSCLPASMLEEVLEEIKTIFNISQEAFEHIEISMEMNPGTASYEKCVAYYRMGINRISIGLQSTSDEELKALGRIHTFEDFMETYRNVRKAGFQNVNVDLMSALPGQTVESYAKGLRRVLELEPEHISAYSLMIEEGTLFYEWYGPGSSDCNRSENSKNICNPTILPLPDEEQERKMYVVTNEILSTYGYSRYEISNYAKKGHACQHNMVYWQGGDYLGLGLGASSLVGDVRFSNISDRDTYIKYQMLHKNHAASEGEKTAEQMRREWYEKMELPMEGVEHHPCLLRELCKLSVDDQMEEFMFLGLRMMAGVSEVQFQKQFGRGMMDVYGTVIEQNMELGLLVWRKGVNGERFLSLSDKGIDVSNVIFAQFLL